MALMKGSTIFNNAAQLRPFLPEDRRQTSYVCLADYSRYTISNLEPFDGTSIDGVRACFFKNERYDVIDFCKSIVEKGYKLYVQPVDVLGYTDAELLELIEMINSGEILLLLIWWRYSYLPFFVQWVPRGACSTGSTVR